jgi:hypothetical protein
MTKRAKKEAHEAKGFACPVGEFFAKTDRLRLKDLEFSDHLSRSGLEFLKAMRSLIDEGIGRLEKRDKRKPRDRATKIEVE